MAGYHYCSSCKRVERNMTIFRCPDCDKPYEIVSDDMEKKNNNKKWYIRCRSCKEWTSFTDKDGIPKACPNCFDTNIKNVGEDSILSEEEYLLETGKIKSENEIAEKDKVPDDKEKKISSEEADNTENIGKSEQIDESENNKMADDFVEKSDCNEIKLEDHKSGIEEINYIEFVNNNDGKVIRISKGKHVLGKLGDVESDYFSEKRYIGRQHVLIIIDGTCAFIEDWNSTNGTRINGERIYKSQGKMRIVNEDIITLADQNFEVRICK
ncbi:FHA domain-containing protein [Eubacterium sp. MSJ-13]|uniref:FHA domain-containing protein n=1 Tax=Eubacterium sp. MSJ-13 TaxID=2841513 RepID=UPI001C117963|nr:FHA domain-containing protein [Eubacterium sp. MSJ-13]MBU5477688.1 FHA domain-containing protein [Eubacterium sp. MSJ-13]